MNVRMKITSAAVAAVASLSVLTAAFAQQQSGQLRTGPPEDVFMILTMDANNNLSINQTEFHLAWGGYYRFNMVCPEGGPGNEHSIQFMAPDLWENSHLRLASVSDRSTDPTFQVLGEINFHVQGLQIRNMECEGLPLNVRVSFYPIKKGTYSFTVTNSTVSPPVEYEGTVIVE